MLKRYRGQDKIREWGLQLARKSCHRKAAVAVARKLAVTMHAMWRDGTVYIGNATLSEEARAAQQHDKARRLLGSALA